MLSASAATRPDAGRPVGRHAHHQRHGHSVPAGHRRRRAAPDGHAVQRRRRRRRRPAPASRTGRSTSSFDHYLTTIVATPKDGGLEGRVEGAVRRVGALHHRESVRGHAASCQPRASAATAPSIDGVWEIPSREPEGREGVALHRQAEGAPRHPRPSCASMATPARSTGAWQDGKFVAQPLRRLASVPGRGHAGSRMARCRSCRPVAASRNRR